MKLSQRLLSAVLSCAFIGSAVVSSGAFAADDESIATLPSDIYDITEEAESKEEIEEEATVEATEAQAEDAVTQVSETEAESTTEAAMGAVMAFAEAAAETPFNVFAIYNAHQGYLDRLKDSANLYRRADGIDVSEWQHEIDWQKVKDAGVDFAIIRAGYGKVISQKDPYFETNVEQAQALGIDTG
ncbi:MAG TPA: GH25 family lysozyme, partial [Ruminococcus flavefaciens]|nr:GH25 family lysozyme [Ruminococcus flavefaciens]